MIYFIQCNGDRGPIKIGYTSLKSAEPRLRHMETDNPYHLRLLASMGGGPAIERAIQKKFADDRIRGEWYRPTHSILEFIGSITNGEVDVRRFSSFTDRQWQMAKLYLKGFKQAAIAKHLGVTRQAVHAFLGNRGRRNALRQWHGHLFSKDRDVITAELRGAMTLRELSEVSGLSYQRLMMAIREGRLEARKSKGIWLSSLNAIKRAQAEGKIGKG